jgi:hypothetical protein
MNGKFTLSQQFVVKEYGITVFTGLQVFYSIDEDDVFKIFSRFAEAEIQFSGLLKIGITDLKEAEQQR